MFGDFIKKVQINHTLVKYPRDIFIILRKMNIITHDSFNIN